MTDDATLEDRLTLSNMIHTVLENDPQLVFFDNLKEYIEMR